MAEMCVVKVRPILFVNVSPWLLCIRALAMSDAPWTSLAWYRIHIVHTMGKLFISLNRLFK